MPTAVIVEGDTDRAVVNALLPSLEVKLNKTGREQAIVLAAEAAKQLGSQRVALLLDRNGFTEKQLADEASRLRPRDGDQQRSAP